MINNAVALQGNVSAGGITPYQTLTQLHKLYLWYRLKMRDYRVRRLHE